VSYSQTLEYEIKVRIGIHRMRWGHFIEDFQSTTYIKLYSLDTDSLLLHSEIEKFQYSIECYEQYTSGTNSTSRLNYISSMGHKFAVCFFYRL
jgi:hypothetical protein